MCVHNLCDNLRINCFRLKTPDFGRLEWNQPPNLHKACNRRAFLHDCGRHDRSVRTASNNKVPKVDDFIRNPLVAQLMMTDDQPMNQSRSTQSCGRTQSMATDNTPTKKNFAVRPQKEGRKWQLLSEKPTRFVPQLRQVTNSRFCCLFILSAAIKQRIRPWHAPLHTNKSNSGNNQTPPHPPPHPPTTDGLQPNDTLPTHPAARNGNVVIQLSPSTTTKMMNVSIKCDKSHWINQQETTMATTTAAAAPRAASLCLPIYGQRTVIIIKTHFSHLGVDCNKTRGRSW